MELAVSVSSYTSFLDFGHFDPAALDDPDVQLILSANTRNDREVEEVVAYAQRHNVDVVKVARASLHTWGMTPDQIIGRHALASAMRARGYTNIWPFAERSRP